MGSLQLPTPMLGTFFLFFCICIPFSHSLQFAEEIWEYNISDTFMGRVVESAVLSKRVYGMVYISFSEERQSSVAMNQGGLEKRVSFNPIITNFMLGGRGLLKWNTPMPEFVGNTRFTTLSLSPDETELFLIGTLRNGTVSNIQSISTENGIVTGSFLIPELSEFHVVRSTAVDNTGIYICGRISTTAKIGVNNENWDMLLWKISITGSVIWRHTKDIANKTCEGIDLSNGYVYSTGTTQNGSVLSGVVYKHSEDGIIVWGRRVSSTVGLSLQPLEILATEDEIFVGSTFLTNVEPRERVVVQKMSHSGTLLWTRIVGRGGFAVGLGYWRGFVHWFVGGTLQRVSRFGEVDATPLNITARRATWANDTGIVLSENLGIRVYRIGNDTVVDLSEGMFWYRIEISMLIDSGAVQGVTEYIREVAQGGSLNTWVGKDEERTVVAVTVRSDDADLLEDAVERVERVLRRSDAGRSALERDLGVVVDVDEVVVEKGLEGKRTSVGLIVGVVTAIALLMVFLVTWYVVTNTCTKVGEQIIMI